MLGQSIQTAGLYNFKSLWRLFKVIVTQVKNPLKLALWPVRHHMTPETGC